MCVQGRIEPKRRSAEDRVAVGLAQRGERGLGSSDMFLERARRVRPVGAPGDARGAEFGHDLGEKRMDVGLGLLQETERHRRELEVDVRMRSETHQRCGLRVGRAAADVGTREMVDNDRNLGEALGQRDGGGNARGIGLNADREAALAAQLPHRIGARVVERARVDFLGAAAGEDAEAGEAA